MSIEQLYEIFCAHPIVTTDSRNCPLGSLFFALKGDSFDGNRFAAMALDKGCAYAVVDDPEVAEKSREGCSEAVKDRCSETDGGCSEAADGCCDERYILVDDVLKTLQALARHHRRQFRGPVIGITGTNGKTTTKELVAAVLAKKYNVLYTEGNLNNHIGVPKTLLRLNADHDIAVIEMGASHPGDIRELVEIAEPDSGLITNVGKAHLQGFGSLEGVINTKGELYDFLRKKDNATIFIDGANLQLRRISEGLNMVEYGVMKELYEGDAELMAYSVAGAITSCAPFLSFDWMTTNGEKHHVDTQLIGSYNILNMLAAIAIGLHYDVAPQEINAALASYKPTNNRSQLTTTPHNKLIVDTYNANPTSMAAAVSNFQLMEVTPKMAILGDMRELGDSSQEEHQRIADMLKEVDFDEVWLVGEEFGNTDFEARKFRDVEEVKAAIAIQRPEGYHILIKGSNGIRLFDLPQLL